MAIVVVDGGVRALQCHVGLFHLFFFVRVRARFDARLRC